MSVVRFLLTLDTGLALVAILAAALIPVSGTHARGLNLAGLLGLLVFAAGVISPALWLTRRKVSLSVLQLIGFATDILLFGGIAFAMGPDLSPYVALAYVVHGIAAFIVALRRVALMHVACIGIGYALVLAYQPGNSEPVTRWIMVMGAVVLAGGTIDWLLAQMRELAWKQHEARALAEFAQAQAHELNRTLELRVGAQVGELQRLGGLRRFLSTPVADAILNSDCEDLLEPHRGEIAVFFCDLRGFTPFAAVTEPEEVHAALAEYFDILGTHIQRCHATVGGFTGDGLMAFFNDPLPCPLPAVRAVTLASELQVPIARFLRKWRRKGHDLGFGVGIALGDAVIGMIGFDGRHEYTALGPVVNLASRLCSEARGGEILIDERAQLASAEVLDVTPTTLSLKGLHQPVRAYRVDCLRDEVPYLRRVGS